ncbi:Helix-turn-helix domain protein [compost metagenome]
MLNKLHHKLEHLEILILRISSTEENKDQLLNVEQASKLLNLSIATLYIKICKKEMLFNKKGKRIYFYEQELMQWIKSGRVQTYTEMKNDIAKSSKL